MPSRRPIELSHEHIIELVDAEIAESDTLDYKETLDGSGGADCLVSTVCAFANTNGGHLIYGVTERRDDDGRSTGVPEEARGLTDLNPDAARLRVESWIRERIQPRIPAVRVYVVEGFPDGPALVVHTPRSFAGPHMVTRNDSSRFYARGGNGNYIMSHDQLRAAFEGVARAGEAARRFSRSRMVQIRRGRAPISLEGGPHVVTHLVPLPSAGTDIVLDLRDTRRLTPRLAPLGASSVNRRTNVDGFLVEDGSSRAYTQLFRNGSVEWVAELAVGVRGPLVNPQGVEWYAVAAVHESFGLLEELGHFFPVSVWVSLVGLDGHAWVYRSTPIDRDQLSLPSVSFEEPVEGIQPIAQHLRPVLDVVAQASGAGHSGWWDAQGRWLGAQQLSAFLERRR